MLSEDLQKTIICNIYRPPQGDMLTFIDLLENIGGNIVKMKSRNIYFLGDFNIDLLDVDLKEISGKLLNMMLQYGFMNFIKTPTRCGDKDSCLDLIFTNILDIELSGTIPFDLSDHDMVFAKSEIHVIDNKKITFTGRSLKNLSEDILNTKLLNVNWLPFYESTDVNYLWDFYYTRILEMIDIMCPMKEFTVGKPKKEWVTNDLLEEIAEKDRLLARARKTKKPFDKEVAKNARKVLNSTNRVTRNKHVNKITEDCKNDPQRFWRELAKILPGKQKDKRPISLVNNDNEPISMNETPNFINSFFANIGNNLANGLSDQWSFDGDINTTTSLTITKISENDVLKLVEDIDILKASSVPGLSTKILKVVFKNTVTQLVHIFNMSLETGVVPLHWKGATVTPIHKGGDRILFSLSKRQPGSDWLSPTYQADYRNEHHHADNR